MCRLRLSRFSFSMFPMPHGMLCLIGTAGFDQPMLHRCITAVLSIKEVYALAPCLRCLIHGAACLLLTGLLAAAHWKQHKAACKKAVADKQ
jgi:hypothetical protein